MIDDRLTHLSAKEMLRLTELLVDEARKDPRVTLDRAEMALVTASEIVQNSSGIFEEVKRTLCHWSIMGMAKDGDEVTSFDYEGDSAGTFAEVEAKVRKTAIDFRESVIGSLGATGASSYNGLVLFHPAAVPSLIASVIGFNVNARSQQEGMSKWGKNMGEMVAASQFNLSEDPWDKTRPGDWTPFDREGVLTQRHDIIKNGVLNFTAHNAFSAKKGKAQLTGNAASGECVSKRTL
jgi:PmbA protein